jgi:short-subunit dehydrogenase
MSMTFLTGASSGIGRSLARRIATEGEPIALVARRQALLDSLVREIEDAGGRAVAIGCDVTDRAAVHAAVRQAEAQLGPTTTLIANAGGGAATDATHFRAQQIVDVVNLNLFGVANCIEAVLPAMLERRTGHLVATGSLAAYRGLPAAGAYSAAKAALTNLMESLRIDLRSSGIDVTVVAPGFVQTKPGKKRNKPFRLELETATTLIHRAIKRRTPYYAFPKSLLMLMWLGWALPAPLYDRLLAGRGPTAKAPAPGSLPS